MSKYDVNKFRNVTVALNTPFDEHGEVDLAATKAVARYFCRKGVKQMYVCGSPGEGFLLDNDERKLVAETGVNEVCLLYTSIAGGKLVDILAAVVSGTV